jgi:DNA-binding transcriptional LysR family regulator
MVSIGSALQQLDWNDVRFFLAVARERTLARAAVTLGVDQSTVGRRIASLESRLRVALFERSVVGFQVTAAGARVLEAASRMEEAALELTSEAADEEAVGAGTVRVATTDSLAETFLVPALRELRLRHPKVNVVVSTGWERVNLRKGEADLALRLVRPTDPKLACRKLADFSLRLYASRDYVAQRGMPTSLDGQALIAYEGAVRSGLRHPFVGLPMEGGELVLLSNSFRVLLGAAMSGLGIVQLPSYVGDTLPELVRVCTDREERYAVWLVVTQSNRRMAVIRAVGNAIAAVFIQRTSGSEPDSHLGVSGGGGPGRAS